MGKKLTQWREDYRFFSSAASAACRQMAFAGIAFIWVFKVENPAGPAIPPALHLPGALFALGLFLDLAQYLCGTAIWGIFHRYHEAKAYESGRADPQVLARPWMTWPIGICFWAKSAVVLLALTLLSLYAWGIWFAVGSSAG